MEDITKKQQQMIIISLCKFQSVHLFKNIGDESVDYDGRSDVQVIIEYQIPEGIYIDNFDIYYTRSITLFEYYYHPIIEDQILYHKHHLNLTKQCQVIENFGLPFDFDECDHLKRGKLFVMNKLVIPKSEEIFVQNNTACKTFLYKFFHDRTTSASGNCTLVEFD